MILMTGHVTHSLLNFLSLHQVLGFLSKGLIQNSQGSCQIIMSVKSIL